MIVIVVMIMVMIMPPIPVFLLFFWRQPAEITVRVAMGFARPLLIVDDFVVVPSVVISMVRIVNAIGMVFAAGNPRHGRGQGRCQEKRPKVFGICHLLLSSSLGFNSDSVL